MEIIKMNIYAENYKSYENYRIQKWNVVLKVLTKYTS